MKNKILIICLLFCSVLFINSIKIDDFTFTPISHASFVIQTESITILIDPVGAKEKYNDFINPQLILLTDIHKDHLMPDLINELKSKDTIIIGPKEVIDKLETGIILNNGESVNKLNIDIEAVPMYNITEERKKFHVKGRGNGYILTINDKRIYISGDTEDVKEMRELQNIDYAFICMNLPYTMSEKQAASAVLDFKPKIVFPYHYRGKEGYSDLKKFKRLIKKNKKIEVIILKWYD